MKAAAQCTTQTSSLPASEKGKVFTLCVRREAAADFVSAGVYLNTQSAVASDYLSFFQGVLQAVQTCAGDDLQAEAVRHGRTLQNQLNGVGSFVCQASIDQRAQLSNLPAIGQPWPGIDGNYAGITTDPDGQLYILISLDARPPKKLNWRDAMDWAASIGADLPNQVEGALLFANLKAQFDPEWHWLNTQYSDRSACNQVFGSGSQGVSYKSYEARARAVRRFPLESFGPLTGQAASQEPQPRETAGLASTDALPVKHPSRSAPVCADCLHSVHGKFNHLMCDHPSVISSVVDGTAELRAVHMRGTLKAMQQFVTGPLCGPAGLLFEARACAQCGGAGKVRELFSAAFSPCPACSTLDASQGVDQLIGQRSPDRSEGAGLDIGPDETRVHRGIASAESIVQGGDGHLEPAIDRPGISNVL